LQQPRPEIVATIASPHSGTATMAGAKGLHPISANFLLTQWVATHWPKYQEGCAAAGTAADPADWRVARTIFVADDDKTAERYGRADDASPYRFYYHHLYGKFAVGKRLGMFKSDPSIPDEAVTLETVLDACVIHGTADKVADAILALRDEIGDFGELVYAGLDWADPALARRSMELMATEVMPRVNAAIGAPAAAPLAAAK
jgi:alkanesulfonate monooxygenase SsuD/methylene tetrahydromethanopterin reductase-like flavin-dependent oxidoreductase (luciferase family)